MAAVNIQRSAHSLGDRGPDTQLGISQEDRNARQNRTSPIKNAVLSVAFNNFCVIVITQPSISPSTVFSLKAI